MDEVEFSITGENALPLVFIFFFFLFFKIYIAIIMIIEISAHLMTFLVIQLFYKRKLSAPKFYTYHRYFLDFSCQFIRLFVAFPALALTMFSCICHSSNLIFSKLVCISSCICYCCSETYC